LGRTRGVAPSKHRDLSRGKLGLAIEDVEVIGDGREAIGSVCHCGPTRRSTGGYLRSRGSASNAMLRRAPRMKRWMRLRRMSATSIAMSSH
jgi:hypothetical protein